MYIMVKRDSKIDFYSLIMPIVMRLLDFIVHKINSQETYFETSQRNATVLIPAERGCTKESVSITKF
jgi:hypothetical protein